MKNISQKSIDILRNILSSSSLTTYPDNLQRKDDLLTEEQKAVFFSDDDNKRQTARVKLLSTQNVTEKANALSNGNHKPGNAFSQHDYDTIISFLSSYETYFSQNTHHQKTLRTILNSVKAAKSKASPYGLISTSRLYDLLEAAHYSQYRVELNRGSRYLSLIQSRHAKEWVKFHIDYSSPEEINSVFRREDLFEFLSLAEISIQDVKKILKKITSSKLSDGESSELVSYITENQPHETKQFKEFSKHNLNLGIAQDEEAKSIVKEHRQVSIPISFLLAFEVTAVFLGVLTLGSILSENLDGIAFIDNIINAVEMWHLGIVGTVSFAGLLAVSEFNLSRKKKESDSIGAKKYYSESEYFRKRKALQLKKRTSHKAIDTSTLKGKGYDIATTDYIGNKLSLSSGSLAFDAITSGGFLKGAFNRVYCENSANFHNVLIRTLKNAIHDNKKALLITKDEEQQHVAKHVTNPNMEILTVSSTDHEIQHIQNQLEEENLGVILIDKMNGVDSVRLVKALYDKYSVIQEHSIPVIVLQDPIEDDEAFDKAISNDIADQIVEVYSGSAEDKDEKGKMFLNAVENTLTALTEEATTIQFQKDTTRTQEILQLGVEQGFLKQYDESTWIDIQTGHEISGDTVLEAEKAFKENSSLYHTISNKVCRIILNPDSDVIEEKQTQVLTNYEPIQDLRQLKEVLSATPISVPKSSENDTPAVQTIELEPAVEPKHSVLTFGEIEQQYNKIVKTITSYQMDISKAIQFPAFNDSTVPAIQEMRIQLRKTKRLIEQYSDSRNGRLDEIVDNVDILQVRVDAAEKTAEKIAWSDITVDERKDMELAEKLIQQIASPGNPDEMRRNLYGKLKDVVNRLNNRHTIVPTELVLELEANAALSLPTAR